MEEYYSGNYWLSLEEMKVNAKYIWNYFKEKGWTLNSVCGMLGNFQSESTINPGIWQGFNEGNYRLGFGLAQWTPASKYIDWCSENGYNMGEMLPALYRIEYELENGLQFYPTDAYPMTFEEFKASTDMPNNLAMVFLNNYEKPSNRNQPWRGEQASAWSDYLSSISEIPLDIPYLKENNMGFWEPISQSVNFSGALDTETVYTRYLFTNNQDGVPKVNITDNHIAMQDSGNNSKVYLDENGTIWSRKFYVQNIDGVAKTFVTEDFIAIVDGWDNTNVYLKSDGSAFFGANLSADSFIDRTPAYSGDALSELYKIQNDDNGNINHTTLPAFVRKKRSSSIKQLQTNSTISLDVGLEDERDIGGMISMFIKAIQQLITKNKEEDIMLGKLNYKLENL